MKKHTWPHLSGEELDALCAKLMEERDRLQVEVNRLHGIEIEHGALRAELDGWLSRNGQAPTAREYNVFRAERDEADKAHAWCDERTKERDAARTEIATLREALAKAIHAEMQAADDARTMRAERDAWRAVAKDLARSVVQTEREDGGA
jgi:hypothetical protein